VESVCRITLSFAGIIPWSQGGLQSAVSAKHCVIMFVALCCHTYCLQFTECSASGPLDYADSEYTIHST